MSNDADPIDAVTAFLVVVDTDGGLDVYTSSLPTVNIQRHADLSDIESASLRLSVEAGRRMLIESLTEAPETAPGQVVAQALAQRSGS